MATIVVVVVVVVVVIVVIVEPDELAVTLVTHCCSLLIVTGQIYCSISRLDIKILYIYFK